MRNMGRHGLDSDGESEGDTDDIEAADDELVYIATSK